MSTTRARRLTTATALLLATLPAAAVVSSAGPAGAAVRKPTMVIVGDSITWETNDREGARKEGYWSYLQDQLGFRTIRYAEHGAGYAHRPKCTGRAFSTQVKQADTARDIKAAQVVLVEGGVNDYRMCKRNATNTGWTLVEPDLETLRRKVRSTMKSIAALRPQQLDSVYVTAPFGSRAAIAPYKTSIPAIIKAEAVAAGFTYLDTVNRPAFTLSTRDGVHPDRAGHQAIYRAFMRRTDIQRWSALRQDAKAVPLPAPSTRTPTTFGTTPPPAP